MATIKIDESVFEDIRRLIETERFATQVKLSPELLRRMGLIRLERSFRHWHIENILDLAATSPQTLSVEPEVGDKTIKALWEVHSRLAAMIGEDAINERRPRRVLALTKVRDETMKALNIEVQDAGTALIEAEHRVRAAKSRLGTEQRRFERLIAEQEGRK